MPVPAERGGVERLDRVGADGGVVGRRGARGARSPGRTAGTGRAGGPGSRCRPARGRPRSDQRRLRSAGTGRSRNSPSRWPPRVVISSPTTTRTRMPRSSAMRRAASAASIRSWSVMAITSRTASRSTRSRISATDAVPSDASVWMWRSARPRRSVGSVVMGPSPGWPRRPRRPARPRRGPVQVRPDRVEGAPPLLGAVGEERLEGDRDRRRQAHDPLASRARPSGVASGNRRQRYRPSRDAPRRPDVDRRAGLEREQRRPGRDRRRVAEERNLDAGVRQVAVGHEPDRLAAPQRAQQGPARVRDRHDVDPDAAPGAHEPALQRRVGDRLHGRRHAVPHEVGHEHDRQLDRAVVHADDEHRVARHQRVAHPVGRLDVEARERGLDVVGVDPGHLEVVARGVAEGRADETLEGVRVGGGAPGGRRPAARRGETLADAAQVAPGPGRAGPARAGTRARRRPRRPRPAAAPGGAPRATRRP